MFIPLKFGDLKIHNIIQFPITNKRHDLSNIAIDPEEVAEKIKKMKLAYFAEISEAIMDDIIRSLSVLKIEDTPAETQPIDSKDIILIKESISAALCRIVGIDHPLHNIGNENIILTQMEDYYTYRFKDEPEYNEVLNDF